MLAWFVARAQVCRRPLHLSLFAHDTGACNLIDRHGYLGVFQPSILPAVLESQYLRYGHLAHDTRCLFGSLQTLFTCLPAWELLISMPSHSKENGINFLYGSQGRKKRRRPSFWGCRPCRPRSSSQERHPGREASGKPNESSSRSDIARVRSPSHPPRSAHSRATRPRRHRITAQDDTMDGGRDRPDYWPSPMAYQDYYSPRPPPSPAPSRDRWPVMQPFRTLVTFIKRCPWAVVSDPSPRGHSAFDDVYYPSVPRSLLHDTAVSFVVKDHTRPDLPEFVISCPFEHVDLVHQLLAPDGSRRLLSARGTSGQPRAGDQLRSMLLDGTPSIELALHTDAGGGVGGAGSRQQRPLSGDRGRVDASRPGSGGGLDTGGQDNRDSKDVGGQHT